MVRRRTRVASLALLAVLAGADVACGDDRNDRTARRSASAAAGTWDLLALVRADPPRPGGPAVRGVGAYGETRTAVVLPVPDRVSHPVTIPPEAVLDFGYAVQETATAEPVRFHVAFVEASKEEEVLLDQVVDARERADDRRWFDARIDLGRLAGRPGSLVFGASVPDAPERRSAAVASFSAPRIVRPAGAEPSLLLITIDCLRADHVGAYGYPRPTTPAIDRFAAEAVRFAHAYSSGPSTMPALPQLFTSSVFPVAQQESLVSAIAAAGITSAAIVNNPWLKLWLTEGRDPTRPDTFDIVAAGDLSAEAITDRALAWLDRHSRERTALYLHYLDAHVPYHPPASYVALFPPLAGTPLPALYDPGVRYIDDHIGRLLDRMRREGRLDRTIVVVTADHGEEFHEHGAYGHGQALYDELLHVPLIVRRPGAAHAGMVVERQVRSIDVAPSLARWMGLTPPATFTGRPLDDAIARPADPGDDVVAAIPGPRVVGQYALRTPRHKLIERVETGAFELHDLTRDPLEREQALAAEPDVAAELTRRLAVARARLGRSGYHLRVVGTGARPLPFHVRLGAADGVGPAFSTIDRADGPRDTTIRLADDGRTLLFEGVTDARGRGLRFDRTSVPDPGRGGRFTLTLDADGPAVDPPEIRVGPTGVAPAGGSFDTGEPVPAAGPAPDCTAPAAGLRTCVWRYAETLAPPSPAVPDAATRERLHALGYVP